MDAFLKSIIVKSTHCRLKSSKKKHNGNKKEHKVKQETERRSRAARN